MISSQTLCNQIEVSDRLYDDGSAVILRVISDQIRRDLSGESANDRPIMECHCHAAAKHRTHLAGRTVFMCTECRNTIPDYKYRHRAVKGDCDD